MAEALNQRLQYESEKDYNCENKAWFLCRELSRAISVNSQTTPTGYFTLTTELIFLLEDRIR